MHTFENLSKNCDYHLRVVAENKVGHRDDLQTEVSIKARSLYTAPSK